MPVFSVNVKWDKQKYKVDLNTDDEPMVFKAQLFALTGVEPTRQKVMMKGKTLADDWSVFKLRDRATLMMMGTVGELPQAPTEKIVFLEDMTEEERNMASQLPPGLPNLGNTCYLNSTIQCLHAIPQLNRTLAKINTVPPANDRSYPFVRALSNLFVKLDTAKSELEVQTGAMAVWMSLQQQNPQFAETHEGHPAQQDASECWGEVVRSLQENVPALTADGSMALEPARPGRSFVDQFMSFEMETTMTCADAPDESPTLNTEKLLQLRCHIEKDVNFVLSGIQHAMGGSIIKNSPTLNRDAEYTKHSALTRLPTYAVVNFVRFYYKQKAQENCKIRKDVKFNTLLDLNSICSEELKEKLKPAREAFKRYNDYTAEEAIKLKQGSKDGKKAEAMDTTAPAEFEPSSLSDDVGSNNSGFYDLCAVLTHRGRTSNSGHYVGWVKQDDGKWLLFDDDKVTETTEEEVLKLSGGGGADWHMAYILVYATKKVPKVPEGWVSMEEAAKLKAESEGAAEADKPMET